MTEVEFSKHAQNMMRERNIPEEWVRRAIDDPDRIEIGSEGNTHYIKAIPEHGGRFLRVVVNPRVKPNRVVTLFFDRRLRRKP
jgi:hypothetical protein